MPIVDQRVLLSHATSSVTKIYTHPNLEHHPLKPPQPNIIK